MSPAEFKAVIVNIAKPELAALGYVAELRPPAHREDGYLWFKKRLAEDICIIIEFQPSSLDVSEIFEFAVNLIRNTAHCDNYVRTLEYLRYQIYRRLAPALWMGDPANSEHRFDYWWHFLDANELEAACLDALAKLRKYGIPFLEDLDST